MQPELSASFLELYHEEVEGVFRFHMVRCADWIAAQAFTVETFITAMRFYDPRKIGPGRKRVWLWRIALLAKERPQKGIDGLVYSGDLLPTQEQLGHYARAAQMSAEMESGPHNERDALALLYAGNLVPEEIQEILGEDLQRVEEWIGRRADAEQAKLVLGLRPVGYFYNHLEGDLRKRAETQSKRRFNLDGPQVWLARYRLRSLLMWVLRFVLLLGLSYLILNAWNSYTRFVP
jgi:DNA-directed RNA polymerase specialized sigma24 family protein